MNSNFRFTEKEQKLIKKMGNGNQDIQLIQTRSNEESIVCYGNTRIKTKSLILCHISEANKACTGHIADSRFNFSSNEDGQSALLCVFIDRRLEENVFLHIKNENYNVIHSSDIDSSDTEEVLLAYIEDDLHSQLIIFDGRLDQRLVEISASKEDWRNKLRSLALSYIYQIFPDLKTLLM
ncbi:TPA: hypothetical protein QCY05_000853 [Bacillus wiedmannii]|nr:hypothetical protein [Bacillus wiedmannii]